MKMELKLFMQFVMLQGICSISLGLFQRHQHLMLESWQGDLNGLHDLGEMIDDANTLPAVGFTL